MAEENQNYSNKYGKHLNNVNLMNDPLEAARAEHLSDRFVFVNGRRFIADVPNTIYPNDDIDSTRKYRQHYIYKYFWRGLLSAPVKEILMFGDANCLDVACGCGIWAMEMARQSPLSTFVGIDIGDDFPDEVKPPNVGFLSGCNLIDGIPFPDNTFDYVHQRHLLTELPLDTWTNVLIPEIVRVTKPLGWIEVDDIDHDPKNIGPVLKEFNKAYHKVADKLGFGDNLASDVAQQFARAGLINIQIIEQKIPIGNSGNKIGELSVKDMSETLLSLNVALQTRMGITEEEYLQKVEQVEKEVTEYETYIISYRVWGQRPDTGLL